VLPRRGAVLLVSWIVHFFFGQFLIVLDAHELIATHPLHRLIYTVVFIVCRLLERNLIRILNQYIEYLL